MGRGECSHLYLKPWKYKKQTWLPQRWLLRALALSLLTLSCRQMRGTSPCSRLQGDVRPKLNPYISNFLMKLLTCRSYFERWTLHRKCNSWTHCTDCIHILCCCLKLSVGSGLGTFMSLLPRFVGTFDAPLVDERLFTFSHWKACHPEDDKDLMLVSGVSSLFHKGMVLDDLQVYIQKVVFPVSLC